jgi:hypothetical protein
VRHLGRARRAGDRRLLGRTCARDRRSLRLVDRVGIALGPLAQTANVARLGHVERKQEREAEERRHPGVGSGLLHEVHLELGGVGVVLPDDHGDVGASDLPSYVT